MGVKKKSRRGKPRWIIEIPYRDRATGKRVRFRKDADVQTLAAAHAEDRRLIAEYEESGAIRTPDDKRRDAVTHQNKQPDTALLRGGVRAVHADQSDHAPEVHHATIVRALSERVPASSLGKEASH